MLQSIRIKDMSNTCLFLLVSSSRACPCLACSSPHPSVALLSEALQHKKWTMLLCAAAMCSREGVTAASSARQVLAHAYCNDWQHKGLQRTRCLLRTRCKGTAKSYQKWKNLQLLQAITLLRSIPSCLESKAKLASHHFNLYYIGPTSTLTDTL